MNYELAKKLNNDGFPKDIHQKINKNMEDIYPVTIFKSRYGGIYEGSKWIAINETARSENLDMAQGDDLTCSKFFSDIENQKITILNWFDEKIYIGKGNTPDTALKDLITNMKFKDKD